MDPRFDTAKRSPAGGNPTFDDVHKYLLSRGLSPNQALAMATNIEAESGFDPRAVGSAGDTGLFQHLGSRKDQLLRFMGGDLGNWKRQIDFALMEPDARKFLATDFKDPYEATKHFTMTFERPADAENKANQRADMLRQRLSGRTGYLNQAQDSGFKTKYMQGLMLGTPAAPQQAESDERFSAAEFQPVAPSAPLPSTLQGNPNAPFADQGAVESFARSQGIDTALQASKDLAWSLNTAWGVPSDQVARIERIAREGGVPKDVVEANPQEWSKWSDAKRVFEKLTAVDKAGNFIYPTAVKWLRNPENAAVAHDDTDWLAVIDQTVRDSKFGDEGYPRQLQRAFLSGQTSFLGQIAGMPGSAAKAAYENWLAPAANEAFKFEGQQALPTSAPSWLTDNPVTRFFTRATSAMSPTTKPGESLVDIVGKASRGDVSGLPALPGQVGIGVVQNSPQLLALAYGGLPLIFGTVASDTYTKSRSEGKDPRSSLANALMQASIEVGTEKMGTERLLNSIISGTAETGARAVVKNSAGQFIEEFTASIGDSWADYATGTPKNKLAGAPAQAVAEGLIGAGTGFGMSGTHTLIAATTMAATSPQAKAVAQKVSDLSASVAQTTSEKQAFDAVRNTGLSKVEERDPAKAASYLDSVFQEHGMDSNLYVDAGTLSVAFQKNLTPEEQAEVWKALGISIEDVQKAAAAGDELPLPKSKAIQVEKTNSKLQGIWDELAPFTRYHEGGMTDAEVDQQMQDLSRLNDRLTSMYGELKEQFTLPPVMKDIREQLIKVAGMPVDEANANISVAMSGFTTLARHFGIPVEQYIQDTVGLQFHASPEKQVKGMTMFSEGKTNVVLFKGSTRDTFMHEMAHIFEQELSKLVQGKVQDPVFAIQATRVLEETRNDPEHFVELFTQYLGEGKAPSMDLVDSFDLFRKWVQQIYRTADAFDIKLDENARGFFDTLLASEADIEQAKVFYEQVQSIQEFLREQEAPKQMKPKLALEFVSEKGILDKPVTTTTDLENGNKIIRTVTFQEAQAEVKKKLSVLKSLLDCMHK